MVRNIKSKQEFDELISSGKVVFIDFYADWCAPCRVISPEFERQANEHANMEGVEFYMMDVDHVLEVAQEQQIQAIPAFHAYKNNELIDRMVGANRAALAALIRTGLGRL